MWRNIGYRAQTLLWCRARLATNLLTAEQGEISEDFWSGKYSHISENALSTSNVFHLGLQAPSTSEEVWKQLGHRRAVPSIL